MHKEFQSYNYAKQLKKNNTFKNENFYDYFESFIYSRIFSERKPNKIKSKANYLKNFFLRFVYFLFSKSIHKNNPKILSLSASVFDKEIQKQHSITKLPTNISKTLPVFGSFKLFLNIEYLNYQLTFSTLKKANQLEDLAQKVTDQLSNEIEVLGITTLIIGEDITFWPRVLIDIFKDKGLKTILISHGGIPSLFDGKVDTKSDIVCVWGNIQKKSYESNSYNLSRIRVIGHPIYSGRNLSLNKKINLENVLVLTKSICSVPPSNLKIYENPNLILKYLYDIKQVLAEYGVEKVCLRLHPSEDKCWYDELLTDSFFSISNSLLEEDLRNASLVIGPTSTSFIDSISVNKPYIFYEPLLENGKTLFGYPLVEPIKDKHIIPLTHSKSELREKLKEDYKYDFSDFLSSKFDYADILDDSQKI